MGKGALERTKKDDLPSRNIMERQLTGQWAVCDSLCSRILLLFLVVIIVTLATHDTFIHTNTQHVNGGKETSNITTRRAARNGGATLRWKQVWSKRGCNMGHHEIWIYVGIWIFADLQRYMNICYRKCLHSEMYTFYTLYTTFWNFYKKFLWILTLIII